MYHIHSEGANRTQEKPIKTEQLYALLHYSCECSHLYFSLLFAVLSNFRTGEMSWNIFFFIHYTLHIQSQLALVWQHSEMREEEKYQNSCVIVAAAAIMCMYTISIISSFSLISSSLIRFKSKWSRHSADVDGGAIAEIHDADASWKIKSFIFQCSINYMYRQYSDFHTNKRVQGAQNIHRFFIFLFRINFKHSTTTEQALNTSISYREKQRRVLCV